MPACGAVQGVERACDAEAAQQTTEARYHQGMPMGDEGILLHGRKEKRQPGREHLFVRTGAVPLPLPHCTLLALCHPQARAEHHTRSPRSQGLTMTSSMDGEAAPSAPGGVPQAPAAAADIVSAGGAADGRPTLPIAVQQAAPPKPEPEPEPAAVAVAVAERPVVPGPADALARAGSLSHGPAGLPSEERPPDAATAQPASAHATAANTPAPAPVAAAAAEAEERIDAAAAAAEAEAALHAAACPAQTAHPPASASASPATAASEATRQALVAGWARAAVSGSALPSAWVAAQALQQQPQQQAQPQQTAVVPPQQQALPLQPQQTVTLHQAPRQTITVHQAPQAAREVHVELVGSVPRPAAQPAAAPPGPAPAFPPAHPFPRQQQQMQAQGQGQAPAVPGPYQPYPQAPAAGGPPPGSYQYQQQQAALAAQQRDVLGGGGRGQWHRALVQEASPDSDFVLGEVLLYSFVLGKILSGVEDGPACG